jgi:hypothetical protein
MGWFRPDLFRRIIAYSGTFVDQQDTLVWIWRGYHAD